MFISKIKGVLAVMLVGLALAGIGLVRPTNSAAVAQEKTAKPLSAKDGSAELKRAEANLQAAAAEVELAKAQLALAQANYQLYKQQLEKGKKHPTLTPEQAIKRGQEQVTVRFKVTAVQTLRVSKSNVIHENAGYREVLVLKDGDRFAVQLVPPAMDTIRRLGIPDKHFSGKVVRVTGLIQTGQPAFGTGQFQIVVTDLTQIEVAAE